MKQHAPAVYACIKALLTGQQWSPEQIENQLPQQADAYSHMTIYRHVRRDQLRRGRLYTQLRQGGK